MCSWSKAEGAQDHKSLNINNIMYDATFLTSAIDTHEKQHVAIIGLK